MRACSLHRKMLRNCNIPVEKMILWHVHYDLSDCCIRDVQTTKTNSLAKPKKHADHNKKLPSNQRQTFVDKWPPHIIRSLICTSACTYMSVLCCFGAFRWPIKPLCYSVRHCMFCLFALNHRRLNCTITPPFQATFIRFAPPVHLTFIGPGSVHNSPSYTFVRSACLSTKHLATCYLQLLSCIPGPPPSCVHSVWAPAHIRIRSVWVYRYTRVYVYAFVAV